MSALPYELRAARSDAVIAAFSNFDLALAYYCGWCTAVKAHTALSPLLPRLINHTNIDGADDASPAAQHGLTADEWERVQEVG